VPLLHGGAFRVQGSFPTSARLVSENSGSRVRQRGLEQQAYEIVHTRNGYRLVVIHLSDHVFRLSEAWVAVEPEQRIEAVGLGLALTLRK
jgi:hypothetical protein